VTTNANSPISRRDALKTAGGLAVASALAGVALPHVHAGEDNTIRVALVGCGGRGTGAAENALLAKNGPTKLVAMADVFKDRLDKSYQHLDGGHGKQLDVPSERKFIGFDAYQKAIDCLRPDTDVVILTTPPAFRWVHFTYAIQKGVNVFMEKPVAVDGPSAKRMIKLGEEASAKNLKVGVGLMCRHCEARQELFNRIKDGQIGDVLLLQAYRMQGVIATEFSKPKPDDVPELEYQIRRFHSFLWASGGCFSDFLIHNIDECCWMKDAWPVSAQASGGRIYRDDYIDQNFDHYSVEYLFADGAKLRLEGRNINGCHQQFTSNCLGTKGAAIISSKNHSPAKCRIYKGHNFEKDNPVWAFPQPEADPYQLEWDALLDAIRKDKLYNEVKRGAEASLVTAMGRKAAHTGRVVTFTDMLTSDDELAPDVDKLTLDGPAPLLLGKDGKYPIPEPGKKGKKEY
jgi:predicted dehydrogenase